MLIAHMTALILMQKKTIDCSRLKFLVSHAEGNSSALNLSGIPMSVLGVKTNYILQTYLLIRSSTYNYYCYSVLQIRRGYRDNFGIICHISP